ncbi:hypothetical protein C8R44DRAFT_976835 [Mycena epipterygia]|nr:hypothetical protein C8R44DRAFT_976835 [Mycena epipterygia]
MSRNYNPIPRLSVPKAHAEDSQPNESIDKRRAIPSLIVPSKPQQRSDFRFRGRGRGRGGFTSGHTFNGPRNEAPGAFNPVHSSNGHRNGPRSDTTSNSAPGGFKPAHSSNDPRNDATFAPGASNPADINRNGFRNATWTVKADHSSNGYRNAPRKDAAEAFAVARGPMNSGPPRVALVARGHPPNASSASTPRVGPPSARPVPIFAPPSVRPVPISAPPPIQEKFPPPTTLQRDPRSPPPLKRRRINEPVIKTEEPPAVLPPRLPSPPAPPLRVPSPPSTPAHIKLEPRTPSPPPADPPRRAVTAGSKRYFPVPPGCTRANPDFVANRRKWAQRECTVLRALGLRVHKFFFRDDGMVIEWTSAEPVWFDTLRPVHVRPAPAEHEIIDVDAEDTPAEPDPPPEPVLEIIDLDAEPSNASTDPDPPPSPPPVALSRHSSPPIALPPAASSPPGFVAAAVEDEQVAPEDGQMAPEQQTAPEEERIAAGDEQMLEDAQIDPEEEQMSPEEEQAQLQQLSLEFIQEYILTFDRDRAALASAYAEDAIFSFRDNNFACPTHFTFQRARPSQQSKSTMPKLPALQSYRFSPHGGVIDVDYDTVVLEPTLEVPAMVMLSVHGQLVAPDARTLAIDQSFILRRNVGSGAEAWPLVAISHQMVVRDTPWVRLAGTLDGLIHRTDGRQGNGNGNM